MHKVLMVIRREYLERVKKKSFWIGTLIFPLITVLLFVGPILLVKATPEVQRKVLLVDATGKLLAPLQKELVDEKLKNGKPKFVIEEVPMKGSLLDTEKSLEPRVSSDESFAILTVGEKLDADDNFQVYLKNTGNVLTLNDLQRAVHGAVVGVRMEQMKIGVDRATLDKVTARIELQSNQITVGGLAKKKSFISTYMGTFIFVFVLFMSMLLYGVAMMRGILEEKSNRIMEVLLGSLTPDQLMTGKILGIGLVGLTQLSIYMVTVIPLRFWLGTMARSGSGDSDFDISSMLDIFSPERLFYFVLFFLLGYLMYTALFAAIGAVCNSEQEAQNLQAPVTWTLMIPMIFTFFFVNNPDSTIAVITSMIPIFTPMVMFMRISLLRPPTWQIALSVVLMIATVYVLFRGVAKIFRIGVLMYGKRPTIPEILKWARS